MSNSYFHFKRFTIHQDRCAMKVTTDACIQGAWTPMHPHVTSVLDIGAGTGLLSLMLAQRDQAILIDAIEYDDKAAAQANENVVISPWNERVTIHEADARTWHSKAEYDLIITNPPFFNNSLTGSNAARNNARHTLSLTYADLLKVIDSNLAENGTASILLPAPEYSIWREMATTAGWHEHHKLSVRHKTDALVNRVVTVIGRKPVEIKEEQLVIYDTNGQYTEAFIKLLSPFYLRL
jgi:tRNA1Val (adenine37-N6)-methyltransferase